MPLTDSDRSLLKRCLTGEPAAWRSFVDRYAGLFVHVVHHVAHARSVQLRPEDVDDLAAEVLAGLVENNFAVLQHFRGESALPTYLTVVARRIVVRELTKRRIAESFGHVKSHAAAFEQAAQGEGDRIENQELVDRMLQDLSPLDAEVVRRFHLEGQSYTEISSRLGVPENTIGPTLSRAREKLRQSVAGMA